MDRTKEGLEGCSDYDQETDESLSYVLLGPPLLVRLPVFVVPVYPLLSTQVTRPYRRVPELEDLLPFSSLDSFLGC